MGGLIEEAFKTLWMGKVMKEERMVTLDVKRFRRCLLDRFVL